MLVFNLSEGKVGCAKCALIMTGVLIWGVNLVFSAPAMAQEEPLVVEITDTQTMGVETAMAGENATPADIVVTITGSIVIDGDDQTAIMLNSDNSVTNAGSLSSSDGNNVTGIFIGGGQTGTLSHTGTISLNESSNAGATPSDDLAQGIQRVGILISGANPDMGAFNGDVSTEIDSTLIVTGQDSAAIRLNAAHGINGTLSHAGSLSILGENSVGIDIAGEVNGAVNVGGTITTGGEGVSAVRITDTVTRGVTLTSTINNSGYLLNNTLVLARPTTVAEREALQEGYLRQAQSAVRIDAELRQGLRIQSGSINQFGSAPAVHIGSADQVHSFGVIGQITDENAEGFNADLLYGFVNQGMILANGILNEQSATALFIENINLGDGVDQAGGFNNQGIVQAFSYRSGLGADADANVSPTITARALHLGAGTHIGRFNNTGVISASALADSLGIFADADNILTPQFLNAIAVDIEQGARIDTITNQGSFIAGVSGRVGTGRAIYDRSGSLRTLTNQGIISIVVDNTIANLAGVDADFNTIAIDTQANTQGLSIVQSSFTATSGAVSVPQIIGDILLGSGDDSFAIQAGMVTGLIAFGAGNNTLTLAGGDFFAHGLTHLGSLDVLVSAGSVFNITQAVDLQASSLSVLAGSTYRPFLDLLTNTSSRFTLSGDVNLADGAIVAPVLTVGSDTFTSNPTFQFNIINAQTLMVNLDEIIVSNASLPFLYSAELVRPTNTPNALDIVLSRRSVEQLGLDAQQASFLPALLSAFETSEGLAQSVLGLDEQSEFISGINQLLPNFGTESRQFLLLGVDGVWGAVSTHLDTARRAQEGEGGVWIEEIGYYADKGLSDTSLSEQYRGYGFGFVAGIDTAWGPFHTLGVSLGFNTSEIEDVLGIDGTFDLVNIQLGLYGGVFLGGLGIDFYAGYGFDDYAKDRSVSIGALSTNAVAEWKGNHYNGSITAGYDIKAGSFIVRPFVNLNYINVSEDAYDEIEATLDREALEVNLTDSLTSFAIDDRSYDVGTLSGSVDIAYLREGKRIWVRPSLRAGYRYDVIASPFVTRGRFLAGGDDFEITAQEFPRTAWVFGFGLAMGTKYSSFGLNYDVDIRDNYIQHSARLVLRLVF